MPGSNITKLLRKFNRPALTENAYRDRRALLILRFREEHSLSTWSAIEKAVRTNAIDHDRLVDEFIALKAFEPLMSKRPTTRREDDTNTNKGRESGPFPLG